MPNSTKTTNSASARLRIARYPARMIRAAIDVVYPPACASCRATLAEVADDGALLCQTCRESFAPPDVLWCGRCGASASEIEAASGECHDCRQRSFAFESVQVLGFYQGPLRVAILRMKRYHQHVLRTAVARLLAARLHRHLSADQFDLVAPVPMHWTRRIVRGTNCPDTLARGIARSFGRPVCCDLLRRNRLTRLQSHLHFSERRSNVRGAFSMSRGSEVRGARVLLIDDVLTTGATCHEVSRTLRAADAACVKVAVVGRTPGGE